MKTIREPTEQDERLFSIYRSAGDLEIALEGIMRRDPDQLMTSAQSGIFNDVLSAARDLLPESRALRQDIEEAEYGMKASTAWRLLHITLVPTLHNALPDEYALR